MHRVLSAFSLVALVLLGSAAPAAAQSPRSQLPRAEIEYTYEQPRSSRLQVAYDRLTDDGVFEQVDKYLRPLRLPQKLTLRAKECGSGQTTQVYRSGSDLVLCYELLEKAEHLLDRAKVLTPNLRNAAIGGSIAHAVLHLVSRDLFDQLKLPVWGRIEDAADRLASFLMVKLGPEKAEDWYAGAALYLALSGAKERVDFTDVTSPDLQRFYNHHCFGQLISDRGYFALSAVWVRIIMTPSDAAEFQKFADIFSLPADKQDAAISELQKQLPGLFQKYYFRRLVGYCAAETNEVGNAFKKEILPFIDQRALTPAQRSKL